MTQQSSPGKIRFRCKTTNADDAIQNREACIKLFFSAN